ncbi:hypothetical protein ACS0TY_033441 [Phlomoides rotata]
MTETAGAVTRADTREAKIYGSVGQLAQNMEAKIIDPESGDPLPPGKRGELWLRGPSIMKGYAGDDAATAETLDSEGWLKTGDLCYFDSDGFLFIVDRLKELIKYKGYQVPPAELEPLLQSMPEVADAAVIPPFTPPQHPPSGPLFVTYEIQPLREPATVPQFIAASAGGAIAATNTATMSATHIAF